MQARHRANEKKQHTDNGRHETHTETKKGEHGHDNQANVEEDKMIAENNIKSYAGESDEEKAENRTWFRQQYESIWPTDKLDMEDLKGHHMTIDQSLKILGIEIQTDEQCRAFFNDDTRAAMITERGKKVRQIL